ncbi:ribose transport system substrate-binding protein [Povalibacter uvarum]|uniref:Ribose transport system substrate-binding protein n=1 Tax=Povalibacter uvarum TaxID=732238 RepID=A0A841HWD9_9GAMM|nr:sugar ABC transporter substrate-binding protein [Povalibacter uvarum]MBB6096105.1 ribose transport system substrate-binding protein [Povalibacter uvarum]
MQIFRRFLAALALSSMVVLPAVSEAAAKPRVALVMKSLANEFFQTMQDGAKAHQKANAAQYDLIAIGIKDEIDTSGQIRLVEQMLAQRVDAIVIAPADSSALVPVLQSAIAKGVIVVNIDNRLDAKALAAKGISIPFVGPDNRAGAKLAGDHLAKQLAAGSKVGIIEGVPTTVNAQQRTLGFRDAMQAAGMKVASVQSGEWELQKGNTVASAMMREHPDLAALLCGNDTMALGAVAAIRSAGKTGKVKVVGYDNIPAVKPLLTDGRMSATVDQFAGKQAAFGIEVALKALAAKTPQASLPVVTNTEVALVTR